ncbi:hypothetical protein H5P28_01310 [Ruficoccus amylovorans]|uniref:Uncharacterized protein n=1 Tax=Ruficoccus amylovorans TaxID=1804625 RepID=A0A842HB80_9BACT|nr:hypothetical protein [Ruficoccus amylovorans]MBC2592887.1 hypothetical protein [Ruficoccus amylovorans]
MNNMYARSSAMDIRVVLFVIVSLVLACLRSAAEAEETRAGDKVAELPYQIRFASFAPLGANRQFLLTGSEDWRSEPFAIPSNSFSRKVGVPARELALGMIDDTGSPVLIGHLSLPEEGNLFLVLLLPEASDRNPFRLVAIRADDPSFKTGDVQFFNLSDDAVGVKLQEKKVLLKPRSFQKISPPEMAEDVFSYQVEFYTQDDERTYLFASTQWPRQNRVRTYLFTFKSPETGRMSYRAIDEFPSWMK